MSDQKDEKLNTAGDMPETDVRVVTYEDDFDFPDIDMEVDLSDIFYEEEKGVGDEEVLRIFKRGEDLEPAEETVSRKTMIADRAEIKEGVLEDNSLEKQIRDAASESDEETEFEDIGRKRKKHRRSFFMIEMLFLLVAAAAAFAFAMSPVFTIMNIEVEGNSFYTEDQIINMSEAKIGGNLFRDAQKKQIKDKLKSNIYFRSVNVRRKIPDTLVIEVEEKEELAALKYGDKFIVIDDRGEILRIAEIDPEVTEVTGMKIKKLDVGEIIEVEEAKAFKQTMAILEAMKEGDIFFKRIEYSEGSYDAYIYDMLRVQGTGAQLQESIEEGTLQKVLNKLMKSKIKRGTIILGDNGYISFSPAV